MFFYGLSFLLGIQLGVEFLHCSVDILQFFLFLKNLIVSFLYLEAWNLFFKKYFIYLFVQRGEGREKEMERNSNVWLPLARPMLGTWPITQACALTGNQTCNPLVYSPALNPQSHTSQGYFNFFLKKPPK